jgi:prolyl oligopeptidase
MTLSCVKQPNKITYPETRKADISDDYFGTMISDPYRWLENDTSAETADWVKRQNSLTDSILNVIPFREKIREKLTKVWNFSRESAPFKKGDYYFYYKNNGLQNQSVLYMKKGLNETPKILLDPNTFSENGTISLSGLSITKDARYAAYSISKAGSDWNEIFIKDIEKDSLLPDHIEWVKFSGITWHNNGFYYSRYDAPGKGNEYSGMNKNHKVFYHTMGTTQQNDILIYEDNKHPDWSFNIDLTEDKRVLVLYGSESTSGNNLYVKNIAKKEQEFKQLITGFDYNYTVVDNIEDKLLILTDNGASKYRLVLVDPSNPEKNNWQEIIPEKTEVLENISLYNGKLIAKYLKDVSSKMYLYSINGTLEKELELPDIGIVGSISSEKDDSIAFFSFENFITPSSIYMFNSGSLKPVVYSRPEISFNPNDYETTQVFYSSTDGTKIPMFITYKKGTVQNGNNPVMLYGYGGFNISVTPQFKPINLVFVQSGGIYAVANLRGGGEYGEEWHKAGTLLHKQNVFNDFISAAEYLIREKYTNKDKIAIHGRSNGGLLIGAAITQRPDLFKVALPGVGVLDMLRYHKFTIGYKWATDYGTSDSLEHFNNLVKYSPLHNVKDIEYPATMVYTADHDDRVVPAHSFKFIATLQEHQKGQAPVLIRIDVDAGHGAGKPVSKQIDEFTDLWAFTFYHLGMLP